MSNWKVLLFNLCSLLLILEGIRGEDGGEKVDENLYDDGGGEAALYRLILFCFLGASSCMFLFFCLKIYLEYRIRNMPVVDHGPFGDLRDLCIDELTTEQRKIIANVTFPEEKCSIFQSVRVPILVLL